MGCSTVINSLVNLGGGYGSKRRNRTGIKGSKEWVKVYKYGFKLLWNFFPTHQKIITTKDGFFLPQQEGESNEEWGQGKGKKMGKTLMVFSFFFMMIYIE